MTQSLLQRPALSTGDNAGARVGGFDWRAIERSLEADGNALVRALLTPRQCAHLQSLYTRDDLYRSRIVMARHGFGRGEYKYFRYPLPELLQDLRATVYPHLVPVANRWNEAQRIAVRYPAAHAEFLRRCHAAGQTRPTPLILRYIEGDYNCLHQDLYGEHVFPLQLTILLSRPGMDFEGGEFVMTQTGSREQRADVVPLRQGDAVVFTVHRRPVPGRHGSRRVVLRHGVARVRSGLRYTAGLIFHDAR